MWGEDGARVILGYVAIHPILVTASLVVTDFVPLQ